MTDKWRCRVCGHSVWDVHSLNLKECSECPDDECQPPKGKETVRVQVDPTALLPGDVVIEINDYDPEGCHCDVLVTVKREET